jgi:hypothetical protein
MAGKQITSAIIQELCKNKRTLVMSGFISKTGKPFKAALVIQDNKIVFEFPDKRSPTDSIKTHTINNNEAIIRVESPFSGVAAISISGPVNFKCTANFGLIPARLAECMGVISAGRYLIHNHYKKRIIINANNRDFVEYALREVIPARKEARFLIEYMWRILDNFESWEIKYSHQKKRSLKGGVVQNAFPKGLFPWLHADVYPEGEQVRVQLPDDPAVTANFQASIRTAKGEGCVYAVPAGAIKVVKAWLVIVKG